MTTDIHNVQNTKNSQITQRSLPPTIKGVRLVPVANLPDQVRTAFRFTLFNIIQSKCFSTAYGTDDNLVIAAPTGSGKTAVMELAVARAMASCRSDASKIVYQAPTKSLCAERYRDWQAKFGPLGLECAQLTGDTDSANLKNVKKASIIITTPEKWDSITRKWKDHTRLLQLVKLFLIDEVHILKEARGATLEAVVSRMKTLGSSVRFVALSATVPNSDDIASWLGKCASQEHLPAVREVFGEDYRPVKLEKHVLSLPAFQNSFIWSRQAIHELMPIISRHSQGKPVLVFCSTRKLATDTAKHLSDAKTHASTGSICWPFPQGSIKVQDSMLGETLKSGVAFHHGGLNPTDRAVIEEAFLKGHIGVICCTSTLAVGVNLPCYLVILLGTSSWVNGDFQEYSDLEVMQMLGRAGRPQFETKACAVILTQQDKVAKYQKMVSGQEILESCLHRQLIEHLNAEIGLRVIQDIASAKRWLNGTFLAVRLKRNPQYYQLENGLASSSVEKRLESLCVKDIKLLDDTRLISNTNGLQCTDFGEAMARYCVRFDTMKTFLALPPKARVSEILTALASASEYRELRMRSGDKSFYKDINNGSDIKYPIKVNVALPEHKVSLIIQTELGHSLLPGEEKYRNHSFQYTTDKHFVFSHASRLVRCIIDCQLSLHDAVSARNALLLSRSIDAHAWDDTASQLRQLSTVGNVTVRKLAAKGVNSIEELCNTESSRIETILSKTHPFGSELLNRARKFPILRVSIKEVDRKVRRETGLILRLKLNIGFMNEEAPLYFEKSAVFVCCITETSDGHMLDFRRCSAIVLRDKGDIDLAVTLTKPTSFIKTHVMCDGIAGTCRYAELQLSGMDDSDFPRIAAIEEADRQCQPLLDPYPALPSRTGDDFDDCEIDDCDLVAAEKVPQQNLVIRDIDDLFEKSSAQPPIGSDANANTTKGNRSIRETQTTEHAEAKSAPQRVKLDNGKWSCNHRCSDKMKCSHDCCRNGVAKPARPRCKLTAENIEKPLQARSVDKIGQQNRPSNPKETHDDAQHEMARQSRPNGLDSGTKVRATPQVTPKSPNRTQRTLQKKRPRLAGSESESEDGSELPSLTSLLMGAAHKPVRKAVKGIDHLTAKDNAGPKTALSESSSTELPSRKTKPLGCAIQQYALPTQEHEQLAVTEANTTAVVEDVHQTESISSHSPESVYKGNYLERTQVKEPSLTGVTKCNTRTSHPVRTLIPEVPDEMKQKRREEEQKQRWSEFDSWLYEKFHEYVDIA